MGTDATHHALLWACFVPFFGAGCAMWSAFMSLFKANRLPEPPSFTRLPENPPLFFLLPYAIVFLLKTN
jgi:hypothetical protein